LLAINKKILTVGKFVFPMLLSIIAIIEIIKFVGDLDTQLLREEIFQLHPGTVILIFSVMFTAVLPMLLYDFMLMKILGLRLKKTELLEQSLIANSYSNLIGFGGIVGGMIRTYFYHKLVKDRLGLIGGIAAVSLFYLTGISFLSFIVVVGYWYFPIFSQAKWLFYTVLVVSFYLPIIIGIHFYKNLKDKESLITIMAGVKLFFISVLEWSSLFLAFWLLCEIMNIAVAFQELFPVFVIATCAGLISMVPGGIGTFGLVFIWGMQYLLIPEEKVLVLLLFYRIGYYLLPFLLSTILFIKYLDSPIKIYYFK
jgi:phosphatidylglycerol lysyltransferase